MKNLLEINETYSYYHSCQRTILILVLYLMGQGVASLLIKVGLWAYNATH